MHKQDTTLAQRQLVPIDLQSAAARNHPTHVLPFGLLAGGVGVDRAWGSLRSTFRKPPTNTDSRPRIWTLLAALALLGGAVSCGGDDAAVSGVDDVGDGGSVESSAEPRAELGADQATVVAETETELDEGVGDGDGSVELSLETSALSREELDAGDAAVLAEIEAELDEFVAELEAIDPDLAADLASAPVDAGAALEFGALPAETAYAYYEGVGWVGGLGAGVLGPVELAKGTWQISFAFHGNVDESGAALPMAVYADGVDYIEIVIHGDMESGELTYAMTVGITDQDNPPGTFEFEVWAGPETSWELFIHPL